MILRGGRGSGWGGGQRVAAAVASHLNGSELCPDHHGSGAALQESIFPQRDRGAQEPDHRVQVGAAGGPGEVVGERVWGGLRNLRVEHAYGDALQPLKKAGQPDLEGTRSLSFPGPEPGGGLECRPLFLLIKPGLCLACGFFFGGGGG